MLMGRIFEPAADLFVYHYCYYCSAESQVGLRHAVVVA